MPSRRRLLQWVSGALVASVSGACRTRGVSTPSDADTGAGQRPGLDTGADSGDTDAVGSCAETPDNIEGPFYRADAPERADLARRGDSGRALLLSGRVLSGEGCVPVAGAVLELWHADPSGRYDNESAAMHYRGRVTADRDGRWVVRTLEPGRYLNGARYRPAHLHVKVHVDGVERLTTQLYVPGDPFNAEDPWYDPALEMVRTGEESATFDVVL